MILHIKPPEGTMVEVGEQGDVILHLPKIARYEVRNQIIGLFDVHTHAPGDRIERDGSFCTPPYDRVTVSVTHRGYIKISR